MSNATGNRRHELTATEEAGAVTGTQCSAPECTRFTEEQCSHCKKSHCDEHLQREIGRKGIHYAYCPACVKKAQALRESAKQQRIQFTAAGALFVVGALIIYLVSGNSTSAGSLAGIGIIMMIVGMTVI